jgi:hypothetical protein
MSSQPLSFDVASLIADSSFDSAAAETIKLLHKLDQEDHRYVDIRRMATALEKASDRHGKEAVRGERAFQQKQKELKRIEQLLDQNGLDSSVSASPVDCMDSEMHYTGLRHTHRQQPTVLSSTHCVPSSVAPAAPVAAFRAPAQPAPHAPHAPPVRRHPLRRRPVSRLAMALQAAEQEWRAEEQSAKKAAVRLVRHKQH